MITQTGKKELPPELFGKTRRAVLALLYGHADESFYLRQIVRDTGMGLGPVQRELAQLEEMRLVTRSTSGRQVYHQANKRSPIFSELKSIITKTAGAAHVIRVALAPVAGRIKVAFIFGSVAGSSEERASDIDLMIVGSITFAEAVSLLSPVQTELAREINPVVYSEAEFQQKLAGAHVFLTTVMGERKVFVIGDEDELRRLAQKRTAKKAQPRSK